MPEFLIPVTRIGYRQMDIPVTADTLEQAQEKALEQASGEDFPNEHHYEYTTEGQAPV
jgi:hypothetical protein